MPTATAVVEIKPNMNKTLRNVYKKIIQYNRILQYVVAACGLVVFVNFAVTRIGTNEPGNGTAVSVNCDDCKALVANLICGTDNRTYDNECWLLCAMQNDNTLRFDYVGECRSDEDPPVQSASASFGASGTDTL